MQKFSTLFLIFFLIISEVNAQEKKDSIPVKIVSAKKPWYETLSLKGYAQFRYNRLLETNENLGCEQCDRSWGKGGGIFVRRARLIFSGNVHERLYIYIQPDLATNALGSVNFSKSQGFSNILYLQLRDLYADIYLNKSKTSRIRVGQSKVPFGFDNLQSSSNRLALDRSDPINSAQANERDVAVFYYWAPTKIRERFTEIVKKGLKGTGDYGLLGFGAYDGQTGNKSELNNQLHVVGRVTYPFQLKSGQYIETSIQGYHGYYNTTEILSANTVKASQDYVDTRAAASLIIYPQPIGFQAEITTGRGPKYNPVTNSIDNAHLEGGYAQIMYMFKRKDQLFTPYFRSQYYAGGKKHERDARKYVVREHEFGIEWQPFSALELTAAYVDSDRTFEDSGKRNNNQKGNLLRLQLQVNY